MRNTLPKETIMCSPADTNKAEPNESEGMNHIKVANVEDRNSMHYSMSSVIVTAQCFGLLPVQGITGPNAGCLRFQWWSLRVIFSILMFIASALNVICACVVFYSDVNFTHSDSVIFFVMVSTMYLLFLQLAKEWPKLGMLWESLEHSQKHYGYPKHLNLKMKIITLMVLLAALIEHILSKMRRFILAAHSTENMSELLRYYFENTETYNQIFSVMEYSGTPAAFALITNFVSTFTWNFTDLYIILVSLALSERFHIFNKHLKEATGKVHPESYWGQIREDYNALSQLTKYVNSCLSKIVFVSFANNMYFICRQLLNSINPLGGTIDSAYFCWSFGFLLCRAIMVSLYAARVHEESLQPKDVLYSVPSNGYSVEVLRLLLQVSTDDIALTAMNFFHITRTLLLTLGGTIVTYEIVLVQFNSINQAGSSNATYNTV